ncbi:MAG: hypothetical protein ACJAZ9_000143 [Neolewinella sp.]|jgi:hypothetical protein
MDAPVQAYLPYFKLYDDYVSSHTTVRNLLCHRIGLGTYSGDAIWYKSEKSAEEIIRQIRHLPQAYGWRGGYGYTNPSWLTNAVDREMKGRKTWQAKFVEPETTRVENTKPTLTTKAMVGDYVAPSSENSSSPKTERVHSNCASTAAHASTPP